MLVAPVCESKVGLRALWTTMLMHPGLCTDLTIRVHLWDYSSARN